MKNDMIFSPLPTSWGLRGDPHVWEELKIAFKEIPSSTEAFEAELLRYIESTIGQKLTLETQAYVDKFAHGGMSSGYICGAFWINHGIPLLIERYKKASQ